MFNGGPAVQLLGCSSIVSLEKKFKGGREPCEPFVFERRVLVIGHNFVPFSPHETSLSRKRLDKHQRGRCKFLYSEAQWDDPFLSVRSFVLSFMCMHESRLSSDSFFFCRPKKVY